MARIVMGNREGALALLQARAVLAELGTEWPDVNLVHRTVSRASADTDRDALLDALSQGTIGIAVARLDELPLDLPEGVTLAAATRRLEPRDALVAKGQKSLADVPPDARIGVMNERDRRFLRAAVPGARAEILGGRLDQDLKLLNAGELDALVIPALMLHEMDHRQRIDAYLEPEVFTPAPGQGSLGLLVRDDDDMAYELAYTLQHRPSFDRVRAERSFARVLSGHAVGALASVTGDGELSLFGAVAGEDATLHATIGGEAGEAEELGRELGQDVLEQLNRI